jgi:hypothetical protein
MLRTHYFRGGDEGTVLDHGLSTFLQGGCALIVGTVNDAREPHATRGWGLEVVGGVGRVIRLLLDASDVRCIDDLSSVGLVAVTGADVRTLRSVQVKGRALGIEPSSADDRRRARRFCVAFFLDIVETDGTPIELLERLVPAEYVVCAVEVDELYDQTPGPGAGAPITADRP